MIYKNISREDYFALKGVNASKLKPYYESSLNGNHESAKERIETPAMRFGTAFHSMILENWSFSKNYDIIKLPINEKTGKEYGIDAKKSKDYLETLPKDKKYLSSEENNILEHMLININRNKHAMKILKACPDREIAITWIDAESGIECKALLDFVGDNISGDLKTCREIPFRSNPDDIAKRLQWDLISNKNLLQFAFYMDGLLANMLDIKKFAVIFAQNNENCETLTAFLSEYSLNYGRNMYSRSIANYIDRKENRSAFDTIIEIWLWKKL